MVEVKRFWGRSKNPAENDYCVINDRFPNSAAYRKNLNWEEMLEIKKFVDEYLMTNKG